jgi:hypothetical protein
MFFPGPLRTAGRDWLLQGSRDSHWNTSNIFQNTQDSFDFLKPPQHIISCDSRGHTLHLLPSIDYHTYLNPPAMPPLILHNVPDDELYIGEDGVQRPYAMVFPGYEFSSSSS